MGIRGMKWMEIRTREKIIDKTVDEKPVENYKEIKPETGITYNEAVDFINGLFGA